MTDYTELVKSLRYVAENHSITTPELLLDAADAIEELQKNRVCRIVEKDGETELFVENRWIPVTERLPKYGERVLVFGGVTMYVAYYDKNRYGGECWHKLNSKSHYCNPTHWMPLPTQPEEETE